jgi:hypothetical protein
MPSDEITRGVFLVLGIGLALGCDPRGETVQPEGEARIAALVTAPLDGTARCLEEIVRNVVNGRQVTSATALEPGSQSTVVLDPVPAGDVEIKGRVTARLENGACVGPTTWIAETIRLHLTPGQQEVTVPQRLLSRASVAVQPDFESIDHELRWTELILHGGPSGAMLNTGPVVNFDPASGRLVAFYPSNPAVPYRNGESSQVWIIEHANGLGGTAAWTRLPVSGELPDNINGNTTVVYTPQNQLLVYGGCQFNCSPAQSDVYQLSNANGLGGPAVWSRVITSMPRVRSGHQSAFDPSTDSMLSFGGNSAFFGTDQNDTAVLDRSTSSWRTLSIAGDLPGARSEAFSSAYDPASRRLMVFGGNHLISTCCPYDISQYNDLWVLQNANGVGTPAWEQLTPAGTPPSPRGGNSAVFDSAQERVLVYGGATWSNATQSSTALGDLWQVTHANGGGGQPEWLQLFPTGDLPGPISNPGAAFDSQNQRMMLIGTGDVITNTPPRVWVLTL